MIILLNKLDIGLKFKYSTRRIIVNSGNGNVFALTNYKQSILQYLGFTNSKYEGKNTYKAEKEPLLPLEHKIYLYITNVSEIIPLATLNIMSIDELEIDTKPIKIDMPKLNELFIKFKASNTQDVLYNFMDNSHKLIIKFNYLV